MRKQIQYPDAENVFALLRLMGCTLIGRRLLRDIDDEAPERGLPISLLAHTADVVQTTYSDHISYTRNPSDREPRITLNDRFTGLLLFVEDVVSRCGKGLHQDIKLSQFIDVLHDGRVIRREEKRKNPGRQKQSFYERTFIQNILPDVVINWIADRYTNVESHAKAKRLSGLLSDAYRFHNAQEPEPTPSRTATIAALLMRYLRPDLDALDFSEFDWTEARRGNRRVYWKVHHRKLLLSDRFPASRWNPEWDESVSNRQTNLVRAIQRRAVVLLKQCDVPEEIQKRWQEEWRQAMNGISEESQLDPFARLRLLELLEEPALITHSEDLQLIALVLLEYGCIYDLYRLVSIVFPQSIEQSVDATLAREHLQRALPEMLQRQHKLLTSQRAGRQFPLPPYESLRRLHRIQLLDRAMIHIAQYALQNRQLLASVRKIRRNVYRRRSRKQLRVTSIDVPMAGKTRQIQQPDNPHFVDDLIVRGAVHDLNRHKLRTIQEDVDLKRASIRGGHDVELHNLFAMSPEEQEAFLNDPPTARPYVVAITAGIRSDKDSGWETAFCNIGLGYWIECRLRTDENRLKIGKPFGLSIEFDSEIQQWRDAREDFGRVSSLIQRGDIRRLVVKEAWNASRQLRKLTVQNRKDGELISIPSSDVDKKAWDVDVSRVFRQFSAEPRTVFARADFDQAGNLIYRPLDGNVTDLLLSGCHFDENRIAILTYIEHLEDSYGRVKLRFAARPGENYLLPITLFHVDAREKLRNKLVRTEEHDPSGLLIAVRSEFDKNGMVTLKLVRTPVDCKELAVHYPDFAFPIDDRNQRWRDLFDPDNNEVAERGKDRNSWFIQLDDKRAVAGYPRRVQVEVSRRSTRQRQLNLQPMGRREFSLTRWGEREWRNARFEGTPIYINHLHLKEESYGDFLNFWLQLQRGDRLGLMRLAKSQRLDRMRHSWTGWTRTNIQVSIEPESFTMTYFSADTELTLPEERDAVVVSNPWSQPAVPLVVEADRIPSEVADVGHCEGVLLSVPGKADQGGKRCSVLWRIAGHAVKTELDVENLSALLRNRNVRVVPGGRIRVSTRYGQQQFTLQPVNLRVHALWRFVEPDADSSKLHFLGFAFDSQSGESRPLAEISPGRLAWLHGIKPGEVPHLAEGDGRAFRGGISSEARVSAEKTGNGWERQGIHFHNTIITTGKYLIRGFNHSDNPLGSVTLTLANMHLLQESAKGDLFSLRREFEMEAIQRRTRHVVGDRRPSQPMPPTPTRTSGKSTDPNQEERARLNIHISGNEPARCVVLKDLRTVRLNDLRVPTNRNQTRWTDRVALAPEEGHWVNHNRYTNNDAKVRVFEQADGSYLASFRKVEPYTPKRYCKAIGEGTDKPVKLKEFLYYVGPEETHPITKEAYDQTHYRFEWGYGKTLLVPAQQLAFNGNSFKKYRFVLFFADAIKRIEFNERKLSESIQSKDVEEAKNESIYGVNIKETWIQHSAARSLYHQYKSYKILHVLHVTAGQENIGVDHVEGFDPRSSRTQYSRATADRISLSSNDVIGLLNHMDRKGLNRSESIQFVIIGRLDIAHYENSDGAELRYRYVRFSFEKNARSVGSPIKDREMVFVQAGQLKESDNEIYLQLNPLDSLRKQESPVADHIGADMQRLRMQRRQFSVRENVLYRMLDDLGELGFATTVLLVRLKRRPGGNVQASMIHDNHSDIPRRRPHTLASLILSRKAPIFATVMSASEVEVNIEVKPGIYVQLQAKHWVSVPKDLVKGAVIRIDHTTEKDSEIARNLREPQFTITRAVYSDLQYMPEQTRLAVVLPKNDLLKQRVFEKRIWGREFWERTTLTLGGFPNVSAYPASKDGDEWKPPIPDELVDMMHQYHPRIVRAGVHKFPKERLPVVLFHPAQNESGVGKIEIDVEQKTATLQRLDGVGNGERLLWEELSFADTSIVEICERIRNRLWVYHDRVSGYWLNEKVYDQYLRPHSAETGPIFFSRLRGKNHTLRYKPWQLPSFGYPVGELINALKRLKQANKQAYLTCHITRTVDHGLWVEISPGRVVELPGQMLVWLDERNGSKTLPSPKELVDCHWRLFAQGDEVDFQLLDGARGALEIERIILRAWRPRARSLLGGGTAFLPVKAVDKEAGALIMGDGICTISRPFSDENEMPEMVALAPHNVLQDARKMRLQRDSIVLLAFDADHDRLTVVGFPNLVPFPDVQGDQWSWVQEPLARVIVTEGRNRLEFDNHLLPQLLTCTGGVLPFTVEAVTGRGAIYLSRRLQTGSQTPPIGRFSMALVQGLIRYRPMQDARPAPMLIVRCGRALLSVPMQQAVSGIPLSHFCERTAAWMRDEKIVIWLRRHEDGTLTCDLKTDRTSADFRVRALQIISYSADKPETTGVVCRSPMSEKLYWLPKAHVGWGEFSAELQRKYFLGETFNARLLPPVKAGRSPQISRIQAQSVEQDLRPLEIGTELLAEVIAELEQSADASRILLVRSSASGAWFFCDVYDERLIDSYQLLPLEVVERELGARPVLRAVPIGTKRQQLDLPRWMLETNTREHNMSPSVRKRAVWINEHLIQRADFNPLFASPDTLRNRSIDEIERLLTYAWMLFDDPYSNLPPFGMIVELCKTWIRHANNKDEIDLAPSLMAVVMLHTIANKDTEAVRVAFGPRLHSLQTNWRQSAVKHLQQLGRRGLRSLHVELLETDWLLHSQKRRSGLYQRLQEIHSLLHNDLSPTETRLIRQFAFAVELRDPGSELRRIARGLQAALGEPIDIFREMPNEAVLHRLFKITRMWPMRPIDARDSEEHTDHTYLPQFSYDQLPLLNELHELLHDIILNRQDVTLLPPLPYLANRATTAETDDE